MTDKMDCPLKNDCHGLNVRQVEFFCTGGCREECRDFLNEYIAKLIKKGTYAGAEGNKNG